MCGLVGFSGPEGKTFNLDKIKFLFFVNQERGRDSYGIYTNNTPGGLIQRDIGEIEKGMSKKDFDIPETNLLIGHVRHATVGVKTIENAHPFRYGNIVLAMNGTLTNHWDIARQYKFDVSQFQVDTQVVAAALAEDQNKDVLSKIVGACATIYTDTNTNKMYVYRNIERPLFRGTIEGCMYISSMDSALKMIGCVDIKEFKENNLYEIKNGVIQTTYKVKRAVVNTFKPAVSNVLSSMHGESALFRALNFQIMAPAEFIGKWLTPSDLVLWGGERHFNKFKVGYGYKCVGTGMGQNELLMINDEFTQVSVNKLIFEAKEPILGQADYAFVTCDLVYIDGENKEQDFCDEGDLVFITDVQKNKKGEKVYEIANMVNDQTGTVSEESLRYGYKREVEDYKAYHKLEPEQPNPNAPVQDTCAYANCDTDPGDDDTKGVVPINNAVLVEFNKRSEIQIYEDQVKSTTFKSLEDLITFTMNEADNLVDDLSEQELTRDAGRTLYKLKVVVDNYKECILTKNLI